MQKLTNKEMAEISGMSERFIQRALELGFINEPNFTETKGVLQHGQGSSPVYEKVPAAEVFKQFWDSPVGRMRFEMETMRAEMGVSDGLF
ncbi:MAG: hypothetical protein ABSB32_10230 [Thermodesulfobacteriota bacterium]|jgi:hypothetical protein